MSAPEHWLFSFRFDRRGQTNLWELRGEDHNRATDGSDIPAEGVSIEARDERRVWIRVSTMLQPDADLEEQADDAEEQARRFFVQNYPDADLAA